MTFIFRNPKDVKPTIQPVQTKEKLRLVELRPEHVAMVSKLNLSGLSVNNILIILQLILTALSAVPVIGPDAVLASALIALYQKATAAYQTATGQPFDLTKIPFEDRV